MTREEAIKIINCYDIGFYDLSGEKIPADKLVDAFDMAIKALEELPKRRKEVKRWKRKALKEKPVVRCKECKHGEKMKSKFAGRITAVFCHLNKKERFMKGNDYCSYGERGRE